MNCFRPKSNRPRILSLPKTSSSPQQQKQHIQENKNVKDELLLRIPECKVHLMDAGEARQLAYGDFELLQKSDESVSLATIVKIGDELQWPLTKDEPVVKLDALHYLFSLPMKDGKPLSYGVAFSDKNGVSLDMLDSFLKENSLFTNPKSSSSGNRKDDLNWKEFAPAIDDYNNALAKAIAGGTGQIVNGIFKCSNAYANQVQKGGETVLIPPMDEGNRAVKNYQSSSDIGARKKRFSVNQSVKRARKLSEMTENMSKAMLDAVGIASARFQPGKTFLSIVASLDAVNKIVNAAEAAEKQAMTANSGSVTGKVINCEAVTGMVTNRFGESAGEAAEDALATAEHFERTARNVLKIQKAVNSLQQKQESHRT